MKEEIFQFLDDLRNSGDVNMFGARPYIMDEFDLTKSEAGAWLSEWMKQK